MMTATECPSSAQLKAVSLGHLSSEESDALFQHVASCDVCRSELETVEDSADSLIGSLRSPNTDFGYEVEPDCQLAVAKALGALATLDHTTAAVSELLTQSVGEYDVVRPLGSGGMGSVFLARHTKLGREVALKVLASHRLAEPRMRERFEAEMRAVGRLSHPNIVTAHDARDVDGMAVLVMEYVSGMDLGQLLLRLGRVSIPDACEIARRIAVALMYTHDQGFIHRDIKPSNVMLSEDGEIKVLDLGLARLQNPAQDAHEITHTGQALGTADYVAPEQVTDSRTVDIRADIYALGCTLFKLLTGNAPFSDERHLTAFAKMTAHVSTPAPSLAAALPEAPVELVQLVDAMLNKSPEARPQTPQIVVERLGRFCGKHDLHKLSQTALRASPNASTTASAKAALPARATDVSDKRKYPLSTVVACGFFGVLIGMLLSIILVITNPDGTRTILKLAEGSSVEVRDDKSNPANPSEDKDALENLDLSSPPTGEQTTASADPYTNLQALNGGSLVWTEPGPLAFGVLARRDEFSADRLKLASELLRQSDGRKPVRTPVGLWYPVATDVEADIIVAQKGVDFALVNSVHFITWPEVAGHVTSIQTQASRTRTRKGESNIQAQLDLELADKMRLLSRANLGRKMALIVHNQIRSAPVINAEIGENIMITGLFTPGELQQLSEWLFGGLVYPLPLDEEPETPAVDPLSLDKVGRSAQSSQDDYSLMMSVAIKSTQVKNSLKQMGIGFHNFHDTFRKFPGTSNVLEGGRSGALDQSYPFSWRVALLPFIEQQELYEQYNFEQPWDSVGNLKLLEKMPAIYRSPFAAEDQEPGHTNFIGVASKESGLGTGGGEKMSSFIDGTSNTLLLVETKCTVPWTKPQDIPDSISSAELFSDHPLYILMADGAVQTMDPIDSELLEKMVTRAGRD